MPWTEKLEQCEYMVQLKCVAMYQDMYMMTEARSSPIQPTQDPRHCHSCVRGQNISLVLPRHLPVCPGYPHGQAGPGLHQPDPLSPTCFLVSSVLPSSQQMAACNCTEPGSSRWGGRLSPSSTLTTETWR